jgi:hypothetical protein
LYFSFTLNPQINFSAASFSTTKGAVSCRSRAGA